MGKRDPYLVERDLARYRRKFQGHLFPALETTPDLRRAETRLAAEVALTVISDIRIPKNQTRAFEAARLMAFGTLKILAKG